jgi:hypothetical protein
MKWTHATGFLATVGLMATGGMWAGCSNGTSTDGGTDSGNGNDVNQNTDTGNGNDSGGNDAGNDTGGGGFDASDLSCNYYCTNIIATCKTTNNQFEDMATCMSMCANYPNDAGAGIQTGDSLACRMYHLGAAMSDPVTHCPHAGPFGYGVCGTLCNDFCEQDFATSGPCAGDNYPGLDACHTYCNGAAGADAAAGAPGNAQTTPSMLCREYHLENAYKAGGTGSGHCAHAGEDGGGICN